MLSVTLQIISDRHSGVGWPLQPNETEIWEGERKPVFRNDAGHLLLDDVFGGLDDPVCDAVQATWSLVYANKIKSPLKLVSTSMKACRLGDFLAFLLSHVAAPRGGSSKKPALAFDVIRQVGQQLPALLQRNCGENLF